MFCKIGAFKHFAKFCAGASILINTEVTPATLLEKRFVQGCFPVNFAKYLRTPFHRTATGDCIYFFQWFCSDFNHFTILLWDFPRAPFNPYFCWKFPCFSNIQLLQDYFSRIFLFLVNHKKCFIKSRNKSFLPVHPS